MLNADSNANANANADEKFSPNWSLFVAIKVRRLRFVAFDLMYTFSFSMSRVENVIKPKPTVPSPTAPFLVLSRRDVIRMDTFYTLSPSL